jgi:hypothetical protein
MHEETAMRKLLLSALAILITHSIALGGPPPPPTNQLYGFVSANRTLTFSTPGPVYDVIGDLVIRPGITLTVEPGVTLRIAETDALAGGDYPAWVEILVQGSLVADASVGDSIHVLPATGQDVSWGQVATAGAGALLLRKVAVRGATNGLLLGGGGSHVLESVDLSGGINGIQATNAQLVMRDVHMTGRGTGTPGDYNYSYQGTGLAIGPLAQVAYPDSTDPVVSTIARFETGAQLYNGATLRNFVVRDNRFGVRSSGGRGTVNYCTVVRNQYGVSNGQMLVLNSIFALNTLYGLQLSYDGWWDYVDSWSNPYNFYPSMYAFGPNVASFDPWFRDPATDDFRLRDGSIFLAFSNSGGQLGAYGPGAGSPVPVRRTSFGAIKALYR